MPTRFNIIKKGYDPVEVDSYIAALEAELKGYRDKTTAINNAIVNAQIAADNIIQNAKNQGRIIKENSVRQLADIAGSIAHQRQFLRGFIEEYNAVLGKYLQTIVEQDIALVGKKIDGLENYLVGFASELAEDLEIEKSRGIS
ncbi:MAG: DivIVA domain-containing protein [Defluviitaleaceae bacterium]|nr:DivIVA domain-containing protein [Defluviitaleaceae bacterium]